MSDYIDPLDDKIWLMRNTLSVIKDKPMKELTYINKGWSSQVLNTNVTLEYETYDNSGKLLTAKNKQTLLSPNDYGPQGYPAINNNYFTQTERYQKYAEAKIATYKRRATPQGRVDDDAIKYNNW